MSKRSNNEVVSTDNEDEVKARAELKVATTAASTASPDEEITGLGPSPAPLHLTSNGPTNTPKPQYHTSLQPHEEPLILTYFAIQGLGEVPKLLLAEAGMPYQCIAVMGGEDQSLALEWRTRSPNGLLPTLSGWGIPRSNPLSQSGTILRFLARKLGMTGVTKDGKDGAYDVAEARADILYETAKDLGSGKKAIAVIDPVKDYAVAKGPFATGRRIEAMLEGMPDPKDGGAVLNYGQIQLFQVLTGCEAWRKDSVKDNLGEVLDSFRVDMGNRSGLKEYLGSTARFPLTKGEVGGDGYVYATGPLKRGDVKY